MVHMPVRFDADDFAIRKCAPLAQPVSDTIHLFFYSLLICWNLFYTTRAPPPYDCSRNSLSLARLPSQHHLLPASPPSPLPISQNRARTFACKDRPPPLPRPLLRPPRPAPLPLDPVPRPRPSSLLRSRFKSAPRSRGVRLGEVSASVYKDLSRTI